VSTCKRHEDDQSGFTLVEVLVAMGLLTVVMTASLPAFLSMLRSSVSTKLQTQAKNLSQERLEQMRDLRFHVDRQNGPFLDLLDIYDTNATTSSPSTTVTVGGTALVGQYISSAAASAGEPAGPFYRIGASSIAGAPGFTETIDTQFLAPDGGVVLKSRYEGNYDSQVVGRDSPPSSALGVTVIIAWTDGGRTKSLRTYTRITDGRPQAPVIQTQARAVAVDITSTAADGGTLRLQGGVSSADGAQSSGSSVSGFASGALATRTGTAAATGTSSTFSLPTQNVASVNNSGAQSGGLGCSWYGFGATGVSNGTGDVSSGLPKAPSNVDSTIPPTLMAGYISNNSGGSCGLLSFDNLVGGGVARVLSASDPLGYEMGAAPYVKVADVAGAGTSISGSTYVSSNGLVSSPQKSVSGATATALQQVTLLPGNPESGGRGLVSVRLLSASVDCTSATTSGALGAAVGKYQFELGWWGKGPSDLTFIWHTDLWSYDSSLSPALVLVSGPTWDPDHTSLGNSSKLSQLISSPGLGATPSVMSTGTTTGLRGFSDGIFSLATIGTLTNEPVAGYSSVKVKVGELTCVADDQR